MNKKVLITGSSGFIGENLTTYLLDKKYHVYAILRNKRINKLQPKPSQMELIHLEETRDWLEKYFSNQPTKLPTLDLKELTDFTQKILFGLIDTKSGQTITYGRLAHQSGFPNAARAVGAAMANNPITIIIPCHRVVQSDGSLGNYSGHGGPKSKQWLLDHESN